MGNLSPHFSRWEFDCPHCGVCVVDPGFLECLERLREEVGKPLTIVSGFRCDTYNRKIGGHPRSQHRWGRAADIPRGYAHVDQCRRAGFIGVGIRAGRVIHVDTTPGSRFFTFRE